MNILKTIKICNDIKKLSQDSDTELRYECWTANDKTIYTLGVVDHYLEGLGLTPKSATCNIIIVARHGIHFSDTKYDRFGIKELEPVSFIMKMNDSRGLLKHGFYKTTENGLPARILYHRLKKEYAKQQRGR